MAHEAIGQRLDESGATAAAGGLHGSAGGIAHDPYAVAVDSFYRDAHGAGPGCNLTGRHLPHWRELTVQVVLAHVHHRQPECLGEVQALVKISLIGRPIAKVCDGHALCALECEGGARRSGDAAADDPEAADQAMLKIHDVHRAGTPAADSRAP